MASFCCTSFTSPHRQNNSHEGKMRQNEVTFSLTGRNMVENEREEGAPGFLLCLSVVLNTMDAP